MVRVFLAHPKSWQRPYTNNRILALSDLLVNKYSAYGKDKTSVRIVSGRDDHQRHFRGDWTAWQENVTTRKDAITGRVVYDFFVASEARVGRATANILGAALAQKRSVFLWDCTDHRKHALGPRLPENPEPLVEELCRVERIDVLDSEDWIRGFKLCCAPKQLSLFEEREAS